MGSEERVLVRIGGDITALLINHLPNGGVFVEVYDDESDDECVEPLICSRLSESQKEELIAALQRKG